jgi:hypothetical protein
VGDDVPVVGSRSSASQHGVPAGLAVADVTIDAMIGSDSAGGDFGPAGRRERPA